MYPKSRVFAFVMAGIAVGILLANFRSRDYIHGMLVLKADGDPKPLMIGQEGGRKTVALTLKNLQPSDTVQLTMAGGTIQSLVPPPIILPFSKWISFKDQTLRGLQYGQRIPLVITLDGKRPHYELIFSRGSDGKVIKTIPLMSGEAHGKNH
jgi:hypothetical protein